MAKDDDRPQFNPRHRIAGAIILVSLAVIFVPMLLDESTTPADNQSLTTIPERDAPETKVVIAPVAPPVAEPAKIASAEPDAAAVAKVEPVPEPKAPATTTAAVEKKTDSIAKAKPVAAKASDVEKISKGWVVQVGTFANAENAGRLREKLQGQGYAVNSESVTLQGNKAVRLRVGPYRDKTAASKIQAQLQKDLSIQGVVLAHP
ncbi:MAG TPA: SPOR domain-containing protein [Burkholderiales bacterium]|nr:SPOR domain-containing protein [Burkholderiales bacterium]